MSDSTESLKNVDYSTEFVVERVLDHRIHKGQLQYLVKWQNFPEEDNTWEMATDLVDVVQDCGSLIAAYKMLQRQIKEKDLNKIYELKAKRLKIDPGIVMDSPFNRDFKAKEILQGYNDNGEISFLIKFWHLKQPEIVPSCIAYVEIPQMVFRFYEMHSNFPSSQTALEDNQQRNSYI
ncbi:chromobox protein homolog 1 [Drosophila serrata]|uniref:chromobox protein homolog 1 n=1 Tax=Drosophila serrata TaxID=7274 RepID=UPI000A1CF7A4|nr:chromobox protein homolog 1 [Drosophila serrata]